MLSDDKVNKFCSETVHAFCSGTYQFKLVHIQYILVPPKVSMAWEPNENVPEEDAAAQKKPEAIEYI